LNRGKEDGLEEVNALPLDEDVRDGVVSAVLRMVSEAFRHPETAKPQAVEAFCVENKFPDGFHQDFSRATAKPPASAAGSAGAVPRWQGTPEVEDTLWRVDVTISTTAVSRVLRPTVTMQVII
jgi:hypothetical protein